MQMQRILLVAVAVLKGGCSMFALNRFGVLALMCCFVVRPAAAAKPEVDAISPGRETIHLFNGKDLTGLYTWLKGTGRKDPGKVYTVHDGMIHISGEDMGYVATEKAYKDYHLTVEYKWGKKTDGSGNVRNSGVLLHGIGPDGAAHGVWMTCLECQLAQGCEGDLIVIRGQDERGRLVPATISTETEVASDGRTRWKRGGKKSVYSGEQFWWSKHQPGFEEKLDTRGRWDVASALGQWTRVDCIAKGNRVTIQINGVTVNEAFDVWPSAGHILLQNEGNEIFFRRVEIEGVK